MKQFIVNQDREFMYELDLMTLHTEKGKYGYPLLINIGTDEINIGTFDTSFEICTEIFRIFNCKEEIIFVSGYSNGGFSEW